MIPRADGTGYCVEELETDKPIVVTERETGTGQVSS